MYTIQGERKGEVGDNETLKTVNFQYPFHELDATRKLQAAKVKADAKVKGVDDKALNKLADWIPKTGKWNTPYVAKASETALTNLLGEYAQKRAVLEGNRDLSGLRSLKAETEAKARILDNNLFRQQELHKRWAVNMKELENDENVDPYQAELLKNKHEQDIDALITNNPDEVFKADQSIFNQFSENIRLNSSIQKDIEGNVNSSIKQTAQELNEDIGRNNFGGVSSVQRKELMDKQRDGIFNTILQNANYTNYLAKEFNKEKRQKGLPIKTREELYNDPEFVEYNKKRINDKIDSAFADEVTKSMTIDNKEAWGSGYSRVSGTKHLASVTEIDYNLQNLKNPKNFISDDVQSGEKIGGVVLTGSKIGSGSIKFIHNQSGKTIVDGKEVAYDPANNTGTFSSIGYHIGNNKNSNLTNIKAVERVLNKQGKDKGLDWSGLNDPKFANGNSEFTGIEKFINSKPKEQQAKYAKAFRENFGFVASVTGTLEDKAKVTSTTQPSATDRRIMETTTTSETQAGGGKSIVSLYSHSELSVPKNQVKNILDIRDGDKEMAKLDAQEKAFLRIDMLSKQVPKDVPKDVVKSGQAGSQNQQKVKKETEYTTLKKYSKAPKK